MDEYISRKDTIAKIREEGIYGSGYSDSEREENVIDMIECVPAADVRPVVLCRNCIYARRYTNKIKCGYWSEQTASEIVCEDDFCSYGEKREES